jgi:5-histidylcysteine sulfoxide synthase
LFKIFYYGHPAALYVNKLRVAGLIDKGINPYFESLFETGVDEMSWDDLSKNKLSWPSIADVKTYRRQVFTLVKELIAAARDEDIATINQASPYWSLVLSMEHERIHLETSSVLISELPIQYVQKPVFFPPYHESLPTSTPRIPLASRDYPTNNLVPVGAQQVHLGKKSDMPSYGWDNEYGSKTLEVAAFNCSQFQVSNGEFYEFVSEGGYANVDFWTEAGWGWRAFRNAKWPIFWVRSGPQGLHEYKLRCLFDEVQMPWSWPVSVNYHEAVAFCNWKSKKSGKRLRVLNEPEFHAINTDLPVEDPVLAPSSGNMLQEFGINANLSYASPVPVNHGAPNTLGFYGVMGNAWEWCNDYFSALPGFSVHAHYEDFSTPCFDGLHHVIKGGSFMSTGNEASVYSRFHFRPHFHQHASFRVVEQLSDEMITSDTDATGPYVGQYPFRRSSASLTKEAATKTHSKVLIQKYFGEISRGFNLGASRSMRDIVLDGMKLLGIGSNARVLDVNCGMGALATALSPHVSRVVGTDHSAEHVSLARRISAGEVDSYQLPSEGDSVVTMPLSTLGASVKAAMLDFRQSDPMSLPAEFVGFDVVVLSDCLDKVSSPNSVLGRLAGPRGLLRPGGLLVVSSAYAWNENVTPRSLWIGSTSGASGSQALIARLATDFELIKQTELPEFWQETTRELRATLLDVLVFKRI